MTDQSTAPASMRAWRVHEWGQPHDVLQLDEVPIPEPGNGEIRVKNQAIPLTSVAIPAGELGRTAVEMAMRQLNGETHPEVRLLSPRLTPRASTAPHTTPHGMENREPAGRTGRVTREPSPRHDEKGEGR